MKEKRNLHLKVQELCDCFATSDPLKEMSNVKNDTDIDEAALKWIALSALHGINSNAKKISITRSKNGHVTVSATYREAELPSPDQEIGKKIIESVRDITHIEGDKGKLPLSLGIRDSSVELTVKIKSKGDGERITLQFPK